MNELLKRAGDVLHSFRRRNYYTQPDLIAWMELQEETNRIVAKAVSALEAKTQEESKAAEGCSICLRAYPVQNSTKVSGSEGQPPITDQGTKASHSDVGDYSPNQAYQEGWIQGRDTVYAEMKAKANEMDSITPTTPVSLPSDPSLTDAGPVVPGSECAHKYLSYSERPIWWSQSRNELRMLCRECGASVLFGRTLVPGAGSTASTSQSQDWKQSVQDQEAAKSGSGESHEHRWRYGTKGFYYCEVLGCNEEKSVLS